MPLKYSALVVQKPEAGKIGLKVSWKFAKLPEEMAKKVQRDTLVFMLLVLKKREKIHWVKFFSRETEQ